MYTRVHHNYFTAGGANNFGQPQKFWASWKIDQLQLGGTLRSCQLSCSCLAVDDVAAIRVQHLQERRKKRTGMTATPALNVGHFQSCVRVHLMLPDGLVATEESR